MHSCYGISPKGERTPEFRSISQAAEWVAQRTGKHKHTIEARIREVLYEDRVRCYGYKWIEVDHG